MFATLTHWLRLLVEPSGEGFGPDLGRWRVRIPPNKRFPVGYVSCGMSYDTACIRAYVLGGVVERVPPKLRSLARPFTDSELWASDPHNLSN